ncbi:hypothetical protein T4B_5465 [Trichinella pseudospiralis]|uniref:Uncharacterized protein n=1 Tax=Trichinella pseudospiralis TaxID=6337 RepID=A0A0V1IX29_TRIPS|nr:hypothetical protein T4E_8964 [Trichinella pseudospiralis]KRY68836.1 hypothetical protein T4A_3245 [Trichinella pseudospiralis]KRZ27268.1 hypothetical protein T4B_5465 [Trichinella pseudospiralis]KRZ39882.1 hypothetical protein T4C_5491 [Trichinella pseudospiralis]
MLPVVVTDENGKTHVHKQLEDAEFEKDFHPTMPLPFGVCGRTNHRQSINASINNW